MSKREQRRRERRITTQSSVLSPRYSIPACAAVFLLLFFFYFSAEAARIKDLARIGGFRSNQLFGYGLVVGLNGTGDRQNTQFTVQTVANLLQEYHIRVSPDEVRVKNVAAVIVTVEIPPYLQPGNRLDVVVSSLGDAGSLSGGTLLLTPLRGPDGIVRAVAQGSVSLGGGYSAIGASASVSKNHQTVGRVVAGALIERAIPTEIVTADGKIMINLRNPDFTTARRLSQVVNSSLKDVSARPISPGVVSVTIPPTYGHDPVSFISLIESLEISPDAPARVVINERTGTVIMGRRVRIAPVAIAHSSLHITIKESAEVSQPPPFSQGGETVAVPETTIVIEEPENRVLVELPGGEGVELGELVLALNALGVSPRDLMAVFEALKRAGALQAELVVM